MTVSFVYLSIKICLSACKRFKWDLIDIPFLRQGLSIFTVKRIRSYLLSILYIPFHTTGWFQIINKPVENEWNGLTTNRKMVFLGLSHSFREAADAIRLLPYAETRNRVRIFKFWVLAHIFITKLVCPWNCMNIASLEVLYNTSILTSNINYNNFSS